jgi:glycine cleavage system aminomethyltransferase T
MDDQRYIVLDVQSADAGGDEGFRLGPSADRPVEAGLALPKVKADDFNGKDAYLKAREGDPVATLCTLVVEDHTSASGMARSSATVRATS